MGTIYMKWWVYGTLIGLLLLLNNRCKLEENNLFDTYVEFPSAPQCEGRAITARSEDGSCNDLDQPAMGRAGMRMGRNVPLESTYPDLENLMNPNPRDISRELLTRDNGIQEVPFLNYLVVAWIQFQIHDWFNHRFDDAAPPHQVPLRGDDPLPNAGDTMLITKNLPDPQLSSEAGRPPAYANTETAWWDLSQLYGSSANKNAEVRSFVDGKLKLTPDDRLPVDPSKGVSNTGFNENWWLGLDIFHTLFTYEHNAVATMLKSHYPDWSDQEIYDHARLITSAVQAKIHTIDWTPAILDNNILKRAMNANWEGFFPSDFHTGNGAISGLMGGPTELHGVPFSLTEEFTAVYRMHPLLRDDFEVRDHNSHQLLETLTLDEISFANATNVMDNHSLADLFYSFGHMHPGSLTLNNYPNLLMNFPVDGGQHIDLGAVDIVRDRERGVPRYNEFRRLIHLNPINDFTDLTPDTELAERLREVYNDDVEALDLMIGSFAEGYRPPGYGFGETSFQVFILMASRRLHADRFFTEYYNDETYTPQGMAWIENTRINDLLLRHMPELASALEGVGNAFFPWDEERSF